MLLQEINNSSLIITGMLNNNLEQQAQALFKSWFVDFEPFGGKMPDDWKVGNLLDIADYLNGLAMQKFRPENNDYGLPILKIKELRQGFCDNNSERCNSNIKEDYIIYDGDVIFSWSGSLLVDLWCGGKCGLNQHLFKVTSKKFDKWFYYAWTRYHLKSFIAVAADKATTMGHIKRNELEKAKVIIPTSEDYQKISKTLAPIYDMIIQNRIENTRLAQLRDTLLPKLMSGEIDVSNVNISADKSSFSDGIYFMCYFLFLSKRMYLFRYSFLVLLLIFLPVSNPCFCRLRGEGGSSGSFCLRRCRECGGYHRLCLLCAWRARWRMKCLKTQLFV